MRDLHRLPEQVRRALASAFDRVGDVVIEDVRLPLGCTPEAAPVTFISVDTNRCEAFLSSRIRYSGDDPYWRSVFGADPIGAAAFLALTASSFTSALDQFGQLAARTHLPRSEAVGDREPDGAQVPSPSDLTDLAAVTARQPARRTVTAPELIARLSQHVRGQDQALGVLARRVALHIARTAPRRPTSLFLVGETGVGKTNTAEVLPDCINELLGERDAYAYLRLDMNEYTEAARASLLLGAAPGYVGYDDGALLIDALRENPRTVLLFDEFEKAHNSVRRILLNLLDTGRLTGAARRDVAPTVAAPEAIILLSSNLGAASLRESLLKSQAFGDQAAIDQVCRAKLVSAGLAPEFVGRLTDCVYYRPLSPDVEAEIATLAIAKVAREYGVTVGRIDPEVVAALLEAGGGRAFGARPLEFAADALLAQAFVDARSAAFTGPVRVKAGSPPECVPLNGHVPASPRAAEGDEA